MDIINVIDKLDALVTTSAKVPATKSRLVDAEKIMGLLEQLRLAIPQDMKSAQEVIDKKDAIINQSLTDARRIRTEAEEEFEAKLEENELVVTAKRRAHQLVEETEQKANRIAEQAETQSRNSRAEADAYVVQTLRNLEREMTTVLVTVRNGLDSLTATTVQA